VQYRYCHPSSTPSTNPDQKPCSSRTSLLSSLADQFANDACPGGNKARWTASAVGAHTRNVAPPRTTSAPMAASGSARIIAFPVDQERSCGLQVSSAFRTLTAFGSKFTPRRRPESRLRLRAAPPSLHVV